ncbi:MAG TPA: branched-chain amino acid permease, partial [Deinococcus radiodurans]|nr:branched-chain amino acid permease [Deinococcus radiodurans]
ALSRVLPGGLVILLAGVGGALLGAALLTRREQRAGVRA